MPVTRKTPTREQQTFDDSATRFSCGDVSTTASALRVAGSQEGYKQQFASDLEAMGVVVHRINTLHDEFEFQVTDARAQAESKSQRRGPAQYPALIHKKHPYAIYQPESQKWYLPYQKTTADDWLPVITGTCGRVSAMIIGCAFVVMGAHHLCTM